MINCFDVESLSVLQKYRFKQTFLIGENVEEFIFDKPFVDERLRASEYFLKDVQQGILSLENFIKINKIKTFNELTKKISMFAFECFETENYEKTVSKECLPIFCRFILDRRLAKDGYFGDTQKFTQNNKEAILVTVYECNFVYETGLQNHYTTENFIQSLKYRFQPSFVYRSNYVHEFQHVIQIVHNLCNENQYDLDGDLDKILGSDDFNVYYSVATEKEAFFNTVVHDFANGIEWETVIGLPKYIVPRIGETIYAFHKELDKYVIVRITNIVYSTGKNNMIEEITIEGTADLSNVPY